MKSIYISYFLVLILLLNLSCNKDEWLDVRSDKSLVVPNTFQDYQALLDHVGIMNYNSPDLGEASADDYYVGFEDWEAMTSGSELSQHNAYIWADRIYEEDLNISAWNGPYATIYYANVALEGIQGLDVDDSERDIHDNIKGSALFFRSWSFFQLAQVFCPPYESARSTEQLGLPLRLTADINIPSSRATLQQTYDQIIADTMEALEFLPDVALSPTRPSKAAAHALLAKVYLQIGDYDSALKASDNSLGIYNTLMDYNTIDSEASWPFEELNEETVYYHQMIYSSNGTLSNSRMKVSPELIAAYEEYDLRKNLFYYEEDGAYYYKGTYATVGYFNPYYFSGIATDEVYLIRSECYARLDQPNRAVDDLNTLLATRYDSEHFVPVQADNVEQVLDRILSERRKELVFRGIRWSDLRRYMVNDNRTTLLRRTLGGIEYTLPPNDPRYTLPIPYNVIAITGMEQNER